MCVVSIVFVVPESRPESRELTVLEVTTGVLPDRTDLQLVDQAGSVVAVVSFWGQSNPAKVQHHQVPLLQGVLKQGEIAVTGRVVTREGRRAATQLELLGVRVVEQSS